MRDSIKKFAALSLLISPLIFLILSTIAMYLYPGGYSVDDIVFYPSWYKFSKNFFSDLGLLTTPTGRPNLPSSILFCVSMTLVGLTFIFHAITLKTYFSNDSKSQKLSIIAIIVGIISAIGFIGVGFTPWDVVPNLHNASVLLGFGVSGIYCFFFGLAVFKEKSYPNFFGAISMGYILVIIAYAFATILSPPFDSFPGLTTHVLSQKVVAYIIMILLPIQAIGSLILLQKKE